MLLTDFKNYAEFKENYSEDSSIRKSLAIDVIKTLNRTKGPFIGVEHAGIASFSEWTLANLVIRCLDLLNNNDGDVHMVRLRFRRHLRFQEIFRDVLRVLLRFGFRQQTNPVSRYPQKQHPKKHPPQKPRHPTS